MITGGTTHKHRTLSKMKKILNGKTHPFYHNDFMFNSESSAAEDIESRKFAQIDTLGLSPQPLSSFITKILIE